MRAGFFRRKKQTRRHCEALAKQLDLGQTKKDLEELDQKACPVCGISFSSFAILAD